MPWYRVSIRSEWESFMDVDVDVEAGDEEEAGRKAMEEYDRGNFVVAQEGEGDGRTVVERVEPMPEEGD